MFERYTEKARRVVFFGRYEASRYGSREIGPEHLLLGLLREHRKVFEILADSGGIARMEEQLRAQQSAGAAKQLSTQVDLPLSNAGKRMLAYAAEEAERLNDRHIGTEHMVLSLLREPGPAADLLQQCGIDLAQAREQIRGQGRYEVLRPEAGPEPRASQPTALDVIVEYVDAANDFLIALLTSPAVVPAIGEEVVFAGDGESRSFRVVNVSYVFPNAAAIEGFSRKSPRIRVSLEMLTEEL